MTDLPLTSPVDTKAIVRSVIPAPIYATLKRCRYAARFVVETFRTDIETLGYIHQTIDMLHGRAARECPICGFQGSFQPQGRPVRFDASCGGCGSLERHRLMYLRCIEPGAFADCDTLLHFAPEHEEQGKLIARTKNGTDEELFKSSEGMTFDIENIEIPDCSVDTVLCYHVLERVDDAKALGELYRVLKPGGKIYCMVMIVEGWAHTYENDAVTDHAGREIHFGKFDHIRYYGRDFRDRLGAAGFSVQNHTASGEETARYSLTPGESVFVGQRPAE